MRIGRDEWKKWCSNIGDLPITCDPDWASSLEDGYGGKFKADALLVTYEDDEELLAIYKDNCRPLARLHLSPFGLYCGIARRSGAPRYQETLATFFRSYAKRYRSAHYCLPFYGSGGVAQPESQDRLEDYSTHVLDLNSTYEDIFENRFKGATRTCIRRAESSDVSVTITREQEHVQRYYEIHRRLAVDKGGYGELHPLRMLIEMVNRCSRCELAVAWSGSQIVAGGIFFADGPSAFYWHGAIDRNFTSLQPNYALLSVMIKRAIASGKRYFNFGGSAGIESLEAFKESWGATRRSYQVGHVTNPLAASVRTLKKFFQG